MLPPTEFLYHFLSISVGFTAFSALSHQTFFYKKMFVREVRKAFSAPLIKSRINSYSIRFKKSNNYENDEILEIYDEHGRALGKGMHRDRIHSEGKWHKTVHIWIANSMGQLLLQQRSQLKKSFPNLWDISCAGHVSFGETIAQAVRKEMQEELGILSQLSADRMEVNPLVPNSKMQLIFQTKFEDLTQNNGTYKNREHVDVFLLQVDKMETKQFILEEAEVSQVGWIHYTQYQKIMCQETFSDPIFQQYKDNCVPFRNKDYYQLFTVLDKHYKHTAEKKENLVDLSFLLNQKS